MNKVLLLSFLIIILQKSYSQQIEGRISKEVKYIEVFEPIGIGPNNQYLPVRVLVDSNGFFCYSSPKGKKGFFGISFKGNPSFCFLTPEDTVSLVVDAVGKKIHFSRKDYEYRFWYSVKANERILGYRKEIGSLSPDQFVRKGKILLKKQEKEALSELDSLYKKGFVNSYVYSKLSKEVRSLLYAFYVVNINRICKNKNSKKQELLSFRNEIYRTLNPTDTSCYNLSKGWVYYLNSFVRDYKVPMKVQEKDTSWSLFLESRNARFFSKEIQEVVFGYPIPLLFQSTMQPLPLLKKKYQYFKYKLPDSQYLPIMENGLNLLSSLEEDIKVPSNAPYYFIKAERTASLRELISKYFSGKPVLISFWASWCGPCKAEFSNSSWLTKEMKKRGVEMLYISLDTKANYRSWVTIIENYGLTGAQLRTDSEEAFGKDIKRLLFPKGYIAIPRYILIGKRGEILNGDLPRPSKKQTLLSTIDKLLQVK